MYVHLYAAVDSLLVDRRGNEFRRFSFALAVICSGVVLRPHLGGLELDEYVDVADHDCQKLHAALSGEDHAAPEVDAQAADQQPAPDGGVRPLAELVVPGPGQ